MSKNNSEYVKQFTSETNLGKEALGAVTMVGLKNSDGTALNTELSDSAIKSVVGRPYLNEMIEDNIEYIVTCVSDDPDTGSVAISPEAESHKYKNGTSVTITATPETGYKFKEWKVGGTTVLSEEAEYTFTVSGFMAITAFFEAV